MPLRVLVVKNDAQAGSAREEALTSAGYHVTTALGFEEAKQRLLFAPPDILITDLRLGAYNGVHLFIYARATNPSMPGIMLDVKEDAMLLKEVQREGGVYISDRCTNAELLRVVNQLSLGHRIMPSTLAQRTFPRKSAFFNVTADGAPATVIDVSYSGFRLEIPGQPDDQSLRMTTVEIAAVGLMRVRPVWARGAVSRQSWWCGVEIVSADRGTTTWRRFVDSLIGPDAGGAAG